MSTNDPMQTNGWRTNERMVLHRLDRIDQELHGIDKRLRMIEGKIWVLQTKAAMMGAISGLVPSVVFFLLRNVGERTTNYYGTDIGSSRVLFIQQQRFAFSRVVVHCNLYSLLTQRHKNKLCLL